MVDRGKSETISKLGGAVLTLYDPQGPTGESQPNERRLQNYNGPEVGCGLFRFSVDGGAGAEVVRLIDAVIDEGSPTAERILSRVLAEWEGVYRECPDPAVENSIRLLKMKMRRL